MTTDVTTGGLLMRAAKSARVAFASALAAASACFSVPGVACAADAADGAAGATNAVPFVTLHRHVTPKSEVSTNFYGSVTGVVDRAYVEGLGISADIPVTNVTVGGRSVVGTNKVAEIGAADVAGLGFATTNALKGYVTREEIAPSTNSAGYAANADAAKSAESAKSAETAKEAGTLARSTATTNGTFSVTVYPEITESTNGAAGAEMAVVFSNRVDGATSGVSRVSRLLPDGTEVLTRKNADGAYLERSWTNRQVITLGLKAKGTTSAYTSTISIGTEATATKQGATAIGGGASATAEYATAVGANAATASQYYSTAVGAAAKALAYRSSAFGGGAKVASAATEATALGNGAYADVANSLGIAQTPGQIYLGSKASDTGKSKKTLQAYLDEATPGDYNNVSNRAYKALQTSQEVKEVYGYVYTNIVADTSLKWKMSGEDGTNTEVEITAAMVGVSQMPSTNVIAGEVTAVRPWGFSHIAPEKTSVDEFTFPSKGGTLLTAGSEEDPVFSKWMGMGSISAGLSAKAGNWSVALGCLANAGVDGMYRRDGVTALGYDATARARYSTAVGSGASVRSDGVYGMALYGIVSNAYAVTLGHGTKSFGEDTLNVRAPDPAHFYFNATNSATTTSMQSYLDGYVKTNETWEGSHEDHELLTVFDRTLEGKSKRWTLGAFTDGYAGTCLALAYPGVTAADPGRAYKLFFPDLSGAYADYTVPVVYGANNANDVQIKFSLAIGYSYPSELSFYSHNPYLDKILGYAQSAAQSCRSSKLVDENLQRGIGTSEASWNTPTFAVFIGNYSTAEKYQVSSVGLLQKNGDDRSFWVNDGSDVVTEKKLASSLASYATSSTVTTLTDEVNTLKATVASLQAKVDALNTAVEDLDPQESSVADVITALKAIVNSNATNEEK